MSTEVIEVEPLSRLEITKLENFESVIERGRRHVFDVARALREIREGKLYRTSHVTFEEYCEERWGFKRSRASQLIGFYKVLENVYGQKTVTAVNSGAELPADAPENERITRELQRLSGDQQSEAWQQCKQLADEGQQPTLAIVKAVVDRWLADGAEAVAPDLGSGRSDVDRPDPSDDESEKGPVWKPIEKSSEQFVRDWLDQHSVMIDRMVHACPIDQREFCYEQLQIQVAAMYGAWYVSEES